MLNARDSLVEPPQGAIHGIQLGLQLVEPDASLLQPPSNVDGRRISCAWELVVFFVCQSEFGSLDIATICRRVVAFRLRANVLNKVIWSTSFTVDI